jgi:surface carbohydrate biosynthesis protein
VSPKPADIVLIVDQKWRDLPGMVALATWLEDGFGCSTDVIPYSKWQESLLRHKPQAMALTHMNGSRSRAIADLAQRMGTRVVVIQTEGRPNNSELMEYAVGHGADVRGVDLWFAWSETVRDYMIAGDILPPEKIVVGGVHRFDFYRPVLNQLLMRRVDFARKYGLDPGKPIISWATNFTCTKFHNRNQDFVLRDWRDLGLLKSPSYADPLEFAKLDYDAREQTLAIIRELLRVRPEIQLALKPHPTEEHDRYIGYINDCRAEFGHRVAFIAGEYIFDVLNAADAHIHRMCTTGVEAWLLNVPSIDLHLADYHGWSLQHAGAATEAVGGNDLVRDAKGLIERIDYYLNGGQATAAQCQAREDYIRRWLYKVDGFRCRAHAEAIAQLIDERRPIKVRATDLNGFLAFAKAKAKTVLGSFYRSHDLQDGISVDHIGQVDCRIIQSDVDRWRARVRPVLLAEIQACCSVTGECTTTR